MLRHNQVDDVHAAIAELESTLNIVLRPLTKGTMPVTKQTEFPIDQLVHYMNVRECLSVCLLSRSRVWAHAG